MAKPTLTNEQMLERLNSDDQTVVDETEIHCTECGKVIDTNSREGWDEITGGTIYGADWKIVSVVCYDCSH